MHDPGLQTYYKIFHGSCNSSKSILCQYRFPCFPIRAMAAGFVDRQGEIPQHTRTAMNFMGSAAEGFPP